MVTRLLMTAAFAAALGAVALNGTASAQYPPPTGACIAGSSTTVTAPGGTSQITITVRDANGAPVAGAQVVLTIVSQPGSGATLTPPSGTTGPDGTFTSTLQAGDGAGTVQVSVDCGEVTTAVSLVVGSPGQLQPPNTGTGDALTGDDPIGAAILVLALLGSAFALTAVGAAVRHGDR
ncbi:MAG: Ig-like domain-containing protein [Dehalococcoidia bacterium]